MIIQPPGHPYEHPDYIAHALIEFKNRNWIGKKISDIMYEYRKTFITIPICHVKMRKGTIIFRGRKNEDDKLFTQLHEIGLKPKDKVHSLGRANIKNEAVFYASTNEETVVREVTQWYINDTGRAQDLISKGVMSMGWSPFTTMMTISAWQVTEDLNLALLFNAHETKRSLAIQEIAEARKKPLNGESDNYHKSFHKILDFFSNEFGKLDVKQEMDYIYSAYYAHEVYGQTYVESPGLVLDGVKYASIANDCRGENIAISESAFLKKISFIGANYCYSYNANDRNIDGGKTALTARVNTAILKDDNSFEWFDSDEEIDYVVKVNKDYIPLKLQSDGSKFKKAVVRIGN